MKPLQEQTLYEILEVPVDAPEAEIVRAWDRVNALYGPSSLATYTLMAPGEAELLGRRLDEAITILLDPEERKRYDARITGTPAPLPGRGEDGTGQRSETAPALVPAPEPRRLPPIIPPLARVAMAGPADEAPTPIPAPTASEVLSTEALAQASAETEGATPTEAATPTETQPRPPTDAPAILLSVSIAPIPLATPVPALPAANEPAAPPPTPVPVSPPFAAVAEAKPPAPAAPPVASRFAPALELVVPDGTRFSGDVLRRAREARGLSVTQVCERTKIMRYHIENLEGDRYDKLPVPVYVRGILMALAKELRLDGQKVARSYLESMQVGLAQSAKHGPGARQR